jgi:hypothetical protein
MEENQQPPTFLGYSTIVSQPQKLTAHERLVQRNTETRTNIQTILVTLGSGHLLGEGLTQKFVPLLDNEIYREQLQDMLMKLIADLK